MRWCTTNADAWGYSSTENNINFNGEEQFQHSTVDIFSIIIKDNLFIWEVLKKKKIYVQLFHLINCDNKEVKFSY